MAVQKQQSDYDFCDKFIENIAIVSKDGKFGYINRRGAEIRIK